LSHVFAFSCDPLTAVVHRWVQVSIARCFPRNRRAQSNRQGGLATVLHHDLGGLDHVRSADCNKSTPATRKTAVMTCSGYSNSFTCIVIYSNPLATFGGYIVSSHVFAFSCDPLTTVVHRWVQVSIARCFPRKCRAQSNRQGGLANRYIDISSHRR